MTSLSSTLKTLLLCCIPTFSAAYAPYWQFHALSEEQINLGVINPETNQYQDLFFVCKPKSGKIRLGSTILLTPERGIEPVLTLKTENARLNFKGAFLERNDTRIFQSDLKLFRILEDNPIIVALANARSLGVSIKGYEKELPTLYLKTELQKFFYACRD